MTNDLVENRPPVKILLVDDEVNITRSLRRLLAQVEGYEVFLANSGAEGLAQIEAEPDFGVIISDQRMPEMTGVEFLGQARERVPEAVRILLTGYADMEATIAAINQGAVYRYLTKPWQDDELLAAVNEAADLYRLVGENKRLNALVAKQNAELQEWNTRLKSRVLDQTSQLRAKSDSLAEANQQLRSSFSETIKALAGLIEMRDRRAQGHSRNVAELVETMAKTMGLSAEEVRKFRSAALLHDIGKIALPDGLLRKPVVDLNDSEHREYQRHVVRGQAAIDPVPELRELGLMIRHHHENFDGSGFPDHLRKDGIPLGARLIAVADCFERKLHQYAEDEAFDSALKAMDAEWGTRLDPELRKVFKQAATEVFSHLDISAEVAERKVSPKELEIGMQLRYDLYSGTGVLLLKKGTIFDQTAIDAIQRCFMIDPFERDIAVLIETPNKDCSG